MKYIALFLFVLSCSPVDRITLVRGSATECAAGGDASMDARADAQREILESSVEAAAPEASVEATIDTLLPTQLELAREKIRHVIVIMQENRSFDEYFGTYPGAEGIPMSGGVPTVCNFDPTSGNCVKPYLSTADVTTDGQHLSTLQSVDGGLMDGFLTYDAIPPHTLHVSSATNTNPIVLGFTAAHGLATGNTVHVEDVTGNTNANGFQHVTVIDTTHVALNGTTGNGTYADTRGLVGKVTNCNDPSIGCTRDLMAYHERTQLYAYWSLADRFVLQDHMFASTSGYSSPEHAALVSAFAAAKVDGSGNCVRGGLVPDNYVGCWTDVTYLLHANSVDWRFYLGQGATPHCVSALGQCSPVVGTTGAAIWNPLAKFTDVDDDGETAKVGVPVDAFFQAANTGALPTVAWIIPGNNVSDHPTNKISIAQKYVVGLLNAIGESLDWSSTAVFLSWDDWGGAYDHVPPPNVDLTATVPPTSAGYGIRVPGFVISPYAKAGAIDSQVLSHDAYLKFIEDLFLNGQRLDPATDGRPDPRPDVRENAAVLGDLLDDFDFTQPPRAWTQMTQ